jgi:LemA protein
MVTGIVIAVVVIIVLYLILTYNRLVSLRNNIKEAFAGIEVYLQNRFDALVKIAEAVNAYTGHERETIVEVTRMRQGIRDDQSPEEKIRRYDEIESRLEGITIQVESYPDLKASDNYIQLQETVNELESKLAESKRNYNKLIADYNTTIQSFPANLIAGGFGFREEIMLKIEEAKKQDVDLKALLSR